MWPKPANAIVNFHRRYPVVNGPPTHFRPALRGHSNGPGFCQLAGNTEENLQLKGLVGLSRVRNGGRVVVYDGSGSAATRSILHRLHPGLRVETHLDTLLLHSRESVGHLGLSSLDQLHRKDLMEEPAKHSASRTIE